MDQVHMGGPWSGNHVLYTFPKVLFAVAVIRNRQNTTAQVMRLRTDVFPQGMLNFRHLFTYFGFILVLP